MSESHAAAVHGTEPHHDAAGHEEHPHVNYWAVFGALCILTVASVIADGIGGVIGKALVGLIVLTVATFKAMFVMLYFMHLKFEGKWKYVLLAPTMVLALAVIAALTPDIGLHYYDVQVPQNNAAAASHHEAAPSGEAPKNH